MLFFCLLKLAIALGICLVFIIKPGDGVDLELDEEEDKDDELQRTTVDTILDIVASFFPPNAIQATLQQLQTKVKKPDNYHWKKTTDGKVDMHDKYTWEIKKGEVADGSNILGLVCMSIVFGVAIASLGKVAQPVLNFTIAFYEIMMVRQKDTKDM